MGDIAGQLVEQVQRAVSARSPLAITGGASKPFLGRGLRGDPLNVGDHTGIVSYEPVELVLTVRAGTRITDIESTLAEQGQRSLAFHASLQAGDRTLSDKDEQKFLRKIGEAAERLGGSLRS